MGLTEVRYQMPTKIPKVETRSVNGADKEYIVGQGVVFEVRSELLGGWFYETIKRNAFDNADMSDVVGLFNHNDDYVLGRSSSGTMVFSVRTDGIDYEIDPPDATWAREMVMGPMKRGDIRGSSFQFSIDFDDEEAVEWRYDKQNQVYYRDVNKVQRLIDLSPVTRPAYSASTSGISKRSIDGYEEFRNKTEAQIKEELQKQEDNDKQVEQHYLRSALKARARIYALS
jgi:HK97 family phage prohead protease